MRPIVKRHVDSGFAAGPRPILVTGIHRSGTTWVGKMLAAGGGATYLHEPFNLRHPLRIMGSAVRHWYQYVCADNEAGFLPQMENLLRYRYFAWATAGRLRGPQDLSNAVKDASRFVRHAIRPRRPLVKCPHSVFSIPWFIQRLGAQAVVVVRRPEAFVGSLKRLDWRIDMNEFLEQPLLMRDCLASFRRELEASRRRGDDVVGQGILQWRMIYQAVANYRCRFPGLIVATHESLSLEPLAGFRDLYATLALPFTPRAERQIATASRQGNPRELNIQQPHAVHLDSRANLDNWRTRLTPDEIQRVRAETADVAALFYDRHAAKPAKSAA